MEMRLTFIPLVECFLTVVATMGKFQTVKEESRRGAPREFETAAMIASIRIESKNGTLLQKFMKKSVPRRHLLGGFDGPKSSPQIWEVENTQRLVSKERLNIKITWIH